MTGRVRVLAMVLAAVVASQAWVSGSGVHAVRYVMGTWCDLVIFDPDPAPDVVESAFREIARLDDVLSSWNPESEVSRLNASAGRGPQPVSLDLARVAEESAALCTTTGGAFDPSVGPLLRAWGFYTESPGLPEPSIGRVAASHVGCDRMRVQRDPSSIALTDGAALDFGGIGKGYAVDRALAILRARGVTRAKLDFGSSSIGFLGRVDGGWPVVIADPRDRDAPLISFRLAEGSVSTSGQRERFFERDGRHYGHIFDPRAGRPVESRLLSVTVIAPPGSIADGLSTALFVMGATEGKRLISRMPGVSAVFVEQGAGGLAITTAGKVARLSRLSQAQ
jgi:thiamine biosynthesis lipoprotein